jgi:hypothetical protein
MFRSEQLVVQTRTSKFGTLEKSWNEKVGVRFGSSGYIILVVDDGTIEAQQVTESINPEEVAITYTNDEKTAMDILLGDGSKLTLTKNSKGLDLNMLVAPGIYAAATGFCFGPPLESTDPVDSASLPSFSVPSIDNMFNSACSIPAGVSETKPCLKNCNREAPVCQAFVDPYANMAPATSTETTPVETQVASVDETQEPIGEGCTAVTNFRPYDQTAVYNSSIPSYDTPISESLAEKRCRALLQGLAKTPDTLALLDFHIQACAQDYAATGDEGILDTSRQAYNGACRQVLQAETRSNNQDTRVKAEQTQKTYGIGVDVPCPGGCGLAGVCSANGCKCDQGVYGSRCEIVKVDEMDGIDYDDEAASKDEDLETGDETEETEDEDDSDFDAFSIETEDDASEGSFDAFIKGNSNSAASVASSVLLAASAILVLAV